MYLHFLSAQDPKAFNENYIGKPVMGHVTHNWERSSLAIIGWPKELETKCILESPVLGLLTHPVTFMMINQSDQFQTYSHL